MSSSSYQRFPGNEEEITIDINKSTVSRIFKCVVENEAGRDEHITGIEFCFMVSLASKCSSYC